MSTPSETSATKTEAPNYPIVRIEWLDAGSFDPWTPPGEIDMTPSRCVSVGFLVREDETALCVSGGIGEEDVCCSMVIPKCCVVGRTVLHPAAVVDTEELRHG